MGRSCSSWSGSRLCPDRPPLANCRGTVRSSHEVEQHRDESKAQYAEEQKGEEPGLVLQLGCVEHRADPRDELPDRAASHGQNANNAHYDPTQTGGLDADDVRSIHDKCAVCVGQQACDEEQGEPAGDCKQAPNEESGNCCLRHCAFLLSSQERFRGTVAPVGCDTSCGRQTPGYGKEQGRGHVSYQVGTHLGCGSEWGRGKG